MTIAGFSRKWRIFLSAPIRAEFGIFVRLGVSLARSLLRVCTFVIPFFRPFFNL